MTARIQNQSINTAQPQPVEPSRIKKLIDKVSQIALSTWAFIIFCTALTVGGFGILPGVIAGMAGLVAAITMQKSPEAPPVRVVRERNLVDVFNATLQAVEIGGHISAISHQFMLTTTRIFQPYAAPLPSPVNRVETRFIVEPVTTYEMARRVVAMGHRPLVLDMANRYVPGGGVQHGAKAQEETICRQSDLYTALVRAPYPLPELGGMLVPAVQFFRNDQYEFVAPFEVDVFVSAAYNCNLTHGRGYDMPDDNVAYITGTKEKMRTMLRCAIEHGNRALVLSAFGCGAFSNDADIISMFYREVFNEDEFRGAFDLVAFGIYDPPGSRRPNYPDFSLQF